jgi:hypothetical protein
MLKERLELKYEGHEAEARAFYDYLLANGYGVAIRIENGMMYIGDIFSKQDTADALAVTPQEVKDKAKEKSGYIMIKMAD